MVFDEISKRIIRDFQWTGGEKVKDTFNLSIYRIAKDINVHPKIVENRLKYMMELGIIRDVKYYAVDSYMPWSRYFILIAGSINIPEGIKEHFCEFPFIERTIFGSLFRYSQPSNGLMTIREFCSISVISPNGENVEDKVKIIKNFCRVPLKIISIVRDQSENGKLLDEKDLRIVYAILKQSPMKININKMAQSMNIPLRTLRRHVNRLLEEGVIYEEVSLDTSKCKGILLPSAIMEGHIDKWLPMILRSKLLSNLLLLYKNFATYSFYIFSTDTFSLMDELASELMKINSDVLLSYRNGSCNNPFVHYPWNMKEIENENEETEIKQV